MHINNTTYNFVHQDFFCFDIRKQVIIYNTYQKPFLPIKICRHSFLVYKSTEKTRGEDFICNKGVNLSDSICNGYVYSITSL